MAIDRKQYAMNFSLAASLLMLVGKLIAYFMTKSTAILSDAVESVVHIFATGVAAFGLWYATRPPDKNHPYGHGKITLFSVGLEGFLVFTAAMLIIMQGAKALIKGPELRELGWGLLITATLGTVNMFLGLFLVKTGRETGSAALVANGQHVFSDMWTSYGVVFGVAVVWMTGVAWLDPIVGILAAGAIFYTGIKLMINAFDQAMDKVSERDTAEIQSVLESAQREGLIISYHQLRHRIVNNHRWIEVHLLFPDQMSVFDAHRRATEIETRVNQLFCIGGVTLTSHIEPQSHSNSHPNGHSSEPLPSASEDYLSS